MGDQVKLFFPDLWFSHMDHLIGFVHSNVKSVPLIWFPLYCRREYIRLGSEQDSAWRDFPQALTEKGGARHYVTLFEAPFQASVLSDSENNALRASSLMVIPPPPPGSQPLAGSTAVDLMGNNLTEWALDVQEVTSYMRWPPKAAMRCPIMDMISVLNRLEGLARVRYCWSCFGVGLVVSALQLLASPLAQWQPCGHRPRRATRPWSLPLRPRPVPPRLERLPRVARCLEVASPSPWTHCRLSLWRTCWQLLALAGVANDRPCCAC